MILSMEVRHVIRGNILLRVEAYAYLCQFMLNRVRSYSNVSSNVRLLRYDAGVVISV